MKLNELKDNKGARHSRMRVGRGIGSGKGKTCGRGHKGQKSRSGVAIALGEQMEWYTRLPRRGFTNIFAKKYVEVNLGQLQKAIENKKLNPSEKITEETLQKAGLVRRVKDGIRLLGKGELKDKLNLEVSGCSEAAKKMIEKVGGSLTVKEKQSVHTKRTAKAASVSTSAPKKDVVCAKRGKKKAAQPKSQSKKTNDVKKEKKS